MQLLVWIKGCHLDGAIVNLTIFCGEIAKLVPLGAVSRHPYSTLNRFIRLFLPFNLTLLPHTLDSHSHLAVAALEALRDLVAVLHSNLYPRGTSLFNTCLGQFLPHVAA